MSFAKGLSMSSTGDRVWAGYIQEVVNGRYKCRLVMLDFDAHSEFFYDYQHEHLVQSVLVCEGFNVAMSGGWDRALVLHNLSTGRTIKKLEMKSGPLKCLLGLGRTVAVADSGTVRFLDLASGEMDQNTEFRTATSGVNCMSLGSSFSRKVQLFLLVGGTKHSRIDRITIPKSIAEKVKTILQAPNP